MEKLLEVKITVTRSKVQSRLYHVLVYLQLLKQYLYQLSTSYTLIFPRYSPEKILKVKVTTARLKDKLRSHYDITYLLLLTNVPTKYQHSTPYSF